MGSPTRELALRELAEREVQTFDTGMYREVKKDKLNFLDYLDPRTLHRYAVHMKKGEAHHDGDNWKRGGYPLKEWLQSAQRHFLALWAETEGLAEKTGEDHAAALWFNIQGFMLEQDRLKEGGA